jgi:hypothetical protein
LIFVAALVAPLLGWTAHLVPFPYLHGGLNTLVLIVAAGFVVFGFVGRWSLLLACVVAAALLPILASVVRDVPFAFAAALVALLGSWIFAESLLTSYVSLKSAAPVPRETALATRRALRWRWFSPFRPLRGAEFHLLSWISIPVAGWLIARPVAEHYGHGDFFAVTKVFLKIVAFSLLASVAHERLIAPLYGRQPYSLRTRARAFFRALVEWCNYNRLDTPGVGVHQDPRGSCATRRRLLIGTLIAWACVWVGLQLETSVTADFFAQWIVQNASMSAIADAIQRGSREGWLERKREEEQGPLPKLSEDERKYVRKLPPDKAEQYLQERIVSEKAEKAAAERAQREADANKRFGEMLRNFCWKLGVISLEVLIPSSVILAAALSIAFGISGRVLAGAESLFGSEQRRRILSTDNWELLVARVHGSKDGIEKDSIFLGTNSSDDTPILVPRKVFREHAHVLGDSGAGKTSMGLMPLITQLMRFSDCSIIVIDLKADDQFVFESLKHEADELTKRSEKPYPFRWFTTVVGHSSFAFNPLAQSFMPKLSPAQRADILTAALGLQYGTDYGRKYFGDANYEVLLHALEEHPEIQSLAELESILAGIAHFPIAAETKKAGTNVTSSIRRLRNIRALNACRSQGTPQLVLDYAIDLDQIFSQPQALYVALPPASGVSSTAEIARIFLYSLLAAAQAHRKDRTPVYLIVDEFQRIVSKNVELFLQQARSMGIGCILSNQSLSDLDAVGSDLISAVRANTRFRQVYGAGNQADIDDLIHTGGETMYAVRGWGFIRGLFGYAERGVSVSEQRGYRLTINDILLATDAPGRNITCVRRGEGYAQFGGMPFVMDSVYHIPRGKYEERVDQEWPSQDARTVVATIADTVIKAVGGAIIVKPDSLSNDENDADEELAPASEMDLDRITDEVQREEEQRRAKRKARRKRGPSASPP